MLENDALKKNLEEFKKLGKESIDCLQEVCY